MLDRIMRGGALASTEAPTAVRAESSDQPLRGDRSWLWLAALVVVLGSLYAATLLRDVGYDTDTAKFQYLGRVLGTAHQPGYPLFTALLAVTVRVIPFGSDALRANLLSAGFGVATCAVFFLALGEIGVGRVVAFAGAVLVGVTETFWSQAIIAEVYTLQTLFTTVVLWLLLRWRRSGRERELVAAFAVYALSFSHTTASVLLAPGIAVFVALVDWRAPFRWRVLRWTPFFTLLAVGPYSYIVWRTFDPSTPYYEVQIRNLGDLMTAVRGTNYGHLMLAFGPSELLRDRLPMFWDLLDREPLVWAVPLGLVGLVRLRFRPVNLLLVMWHGAVTLWGLEYDIGDIFVYFILSYVIIVLWATVGFDWLADTACARLHAADHPSVRLAVPALFLFAPILVAWVNFSLVDMSEDATGAEIRAVLNAMPEGGVIFTHGNAYHHFNYELLGKGRQDELDVYVQYPQPFERIALYCRGEPIGLGGVVGQAPPGLPVYAYGAGYQARLKFEGFFLQPIVDELARIDCAQLPPRHVPSTGADPQPGTPHHVRAPR